MTTPVLLDASCLLAWAFAESGSDRVEAVLPEAFVTAVNMAEVIAKLDRMGEPGMAFAGDLVAAGLTVVPVGWTHASHVATVVACEGATGSRRRLSLGDLCCLAYAIEHGMQAWTSDRDWALLDLPAPVVVIRDR